MLRICTECGDEYDTKNRKGGLITHCADCAVETVTPYTGAMVYDHKTGGQLQINEDPALTEYLNARPAGYGWSENNYHTVSAYRKSGGVKHIAPRYNAKGE